MTDIAGVVGFQEGLHESTVVDFLSVANFSSSGVSGDLNVANEFVMLLDAANQVSIHDLYMVGVKENFEAGRRDGFHDLDTGIDVVALVSGVPLHLLGDA